MVLASPPTLTATRYLVDFVPGTVGRPCGMGATLSCSRPGHPAPLRSRSGLLPGVAVLAGRGRGGGIREGSLKSYILKVMRPGEVMAVKDIAALVRSRGYRTDSSNFANQVSNALAQIPTVRKVSRGKFKV